MMQMEESLEARQAALSGTRMLIREDEFEALVTLLTECKVVPIAVMTLSLEQIAGGLIAKARRQLESEWAIYPSELFDRARKLHDLAASLR